MDAKVLLDFLQYSSESNSTRKLFKRVLQAILTPYLPSSTVDAFRSIKLPKSKSKLHKPIKDVQALLSEVEAFNPHLHLCCLLAYGCLLRPHREIRELTWNDFADDLSFISLSGSRNKGKRNRIVPIPAFVLPTCILLILLTTSSLEQRTHTTPTTLKLCGGNSRRSLYCSEGTDPLLL